MNILFVLNFKFKFIKILNEVKNSVTFQVLHGHMWLVSTLLVKADLNNCGQYTAKVKSVFSWGLDTRVGKHLLLLTLCFLKYVYNIINLFLHIKNYKQVVWDLELIQLLDPFKEEE